MWKFSYKTDGIAKKKWNIFNYNLSDSCVQCGKKLVFCKYVTLCKEVHKSAFSNIRISNQRNPYHIASVASLCRHLAVNFLELLFKTTDFIKDYPPVCFNLTLSRTSHSNSSTLTFKV